MSKWKLYKTARKRGIYAEIKKQNQAQALSKVPSNVQHFADLGVYKQLKKKTHLAKDAMFPHLPPGSGAGVPGSAAAVVAAAAVEAEVYKAAASNNNNNPDTPNANLHDLQKKMFHHPAVGTNGSSNGSKDLIIDDDMDDEEDDEAELEELEAEARRRAAAKAAAAVAAAAAAAAAADKDLVSHWSPF